ncbi:intracellular multiplication protein IcmK [Piscirickettsia salmonis]|uniref:Type IV secretion system protein IcmK n=1 Tax=Piscirickettsia salmonis TaxID=1238 RepID=A0A1L6TEF4_PISSA|nr:DotH/IcmK family type IV secretion protein [Piscirickettsia salmonis]AKP72645.1 hypothetical protein PSLF89_503 [Piscirickettsia salmonis LF-89 = ATCC VR-1361]ALB23863.1 type IV secretion system protein IcmK [Piscirickettsia salmonis]ALY03701.1 hypothetical protein AWE47_13230 [Piscirickettsia salmonis]AMA43264.1 hypothetical protein AWJ11_13455 [Piscirickettsia salmonis]AOS35734.1 hypothetical protein AVM72_10575 [Piscirickettsia salmonis]
MKFSNIILFSIKIFAISLYIYANNNLSNDLNHSKKNVNSSNNRAFEQLTKQAFPLSPEQIHQYKNNYVAEQKASIDPVGEEPSQSSSAIIPVSLQPGGIQPIVRVTKGMITSIVMTDQNGKVWPIESYSLGDKNSFNINWNKLSGVLMVQGIKPYGQTNIGVLLKGLHVPVMLSLVLGQKHWDYLDYIRVQSNQDGSSANTETVANAADYLIQLLNGIPVQGAKQLVTNAPATLQAQVWLYQGHYLLLTTGTLISPAWSARQTSTGPNKLHAYKLPVSPSLLISSNGVMQQVTVTTEKNQ